MDDFFQNPFIAKITCEHPLPIPLDEFSEDEKMFFDLIDWSSREFFTSSFYEQPEGVTVLSYSITEEGDFYVEKTKIEILTDENGNTKIEEKDDGIEKKDFTGEIYFTTDFLGDKKSSLDSNFDYSFTFKSLFYKGELKEIHLHEYKKNENKGRKLLQEKVAKATEKNLRRSESIPCKIVHYLFIPFVYVFYIPYNILVWVCHIFGKIITSIKGVERKIKSKILK